jgi:hypothetical protein
MSYKELAGPAPKVESVKVIPPSVSDEVTVDPPQQFSEDQYVTEPAPQTGPAVPFDTKKFAPKITPKEASSLSVAALRGSGTDFEAQAAVIKGRVEKNFLRRILPIFDYRDCVSYGEVRRYIFIKGNCIFVYGQDIDPFPLYAIQIQTVSAEIENRSKPDPNSYTVSPQVQTNQTASTLVTILLRDIKSKKQVYQISFDISNDPSIVKRFLDVLETNAKHYGGHVTTASIITANDIAKGYINNSKK